MTRQKPWRQFEEYGIAIYAPTAAGGRYRITFTDETGKQRERAGGKDARTAVNRAQELGKLMGRGVDRAATVGRLLDDYLKPENHRTRRGKSWSVRYAQEEARRVRLHIRPYLNVRAPALRLTPGDFVRILNAAEEKGLEPSTVETIGKTCRAIVSYGLREQMLVENLMRGVPYIVSSVNDPSGGQRDSRRVDPKTIPTLDHVADLVWAAAVHLDARTRQARSGRGGSRIIDVCGMGRPLMPAFTAGTGLRFGELAEVRAPDVDVDRLLVKVRRQWVEPGGGRAPYADAPKGGKSRTTVMAGWLEEDVAAHVERRVAQAGPNALLFPAPAGGHLSRRNHARWWKPVKVAAGWLAGPDDDDGEASVVDDDDHGDGSRWTFHSLRHLYAVTCLAPTAQGGWGSTIEDLSALLGHHSPQFTARRYLTRRDGVEARVAAAARGVTM